MELNIAIDQTLADVCQEIVKVNPPSSRNYLQCSSVGADCERQTWYRWRWCLDEQFDAKTLCNFESGHADEELMSGRLRAVPYIKLQTGYDDGTQYEVNYLNGHVLGHLDGVIEKIKAAPKTMHVWEHKSVNPTKFKKLDKLKQEHGEKAALEHWDTVYYAQAQLYMGLTRLTRHYLTVTTPGGREMTTCRTNYDSGAFKKLKEKIQKIFDSEEAPPRISKKPDYYKCRWCSFSEICHGNKVPQVNCRTCAHSTPIAEKSTSSPETPARKGPWKCERHNKSLSTTAQRSGCGDHLFIPSLINWAEAVKLDKVNNQIVYCTQNERTFVNASKNDWGSEPMRFTSKDLQHLTEDLLVSEEDVLKTMAGFQTAHIESIRKTKEEKTSPTPFDDEIPF